MKKKINCEICQKKNLKTIEFGRMPIANNYSLKNNKYRYNCVISYCSNCKVLKNINQPNEKILFSKNYPYYSSLSKNFVKYLSNLSLKIYNEHLKPKVTKNYTPFILEIGSSDGAFLNPLKEKKVRHLGVEPTQKNHLSAKKRGINSLKVFFNTQEANKIEKKYGKADIIYSTNVIAHINGILKTFKNISKLIAEDGIFIFENIYLHDVLKNCSFDQLYDEHVYTISVSTVNELCKICDLNLKKIEKTKIQGGSLRYYITTKNSRFATDKSVSNYLKSEKNSSYLSLKGIDKFYQSAKKTRTNLNKLLTNLKNNNKVVVGYGASAKATFLLNFSKIEENKLSFIFDNSIFKINRFLPGTKIKILEPKDFKKIEFDYVLVLAWNHFSEIYDNNKKYHKNNRVKWIIPMPEIKII